MKRLPNQLTEKILVEIVSGKESVYQIKLYLVNCILDPVEESIAPNYYAVQRGPKFFVERIFFIVLREKHLLLVQSCSIINYRN